MEKLGVNPERIQIPHPGCKINTFRPHEPYEETRRRLLSAAHRDKIILSVGNLVSRKGHDMVIRALPRLLDTIGKVRYLIAGDGPYRAELEDLASSLGVQGHVVFAGKVPDADLPDIYSLCDLFVLPSREQPESCDAERFGMVFLEANASGKPVVAGKSGGVGDAVLDGETGLLVEPRNP